MAGPGSCAQRPCVPGLLTSEEPSPYTAHPRGLVSRLIDVPATSSQGADARPCDSGAKAWSPFAARAGKKGDVSASPTMSGADGGSPRCEAKRARALSRYVSGEVPSAP